jgi:hypothetical protein
MRYMPRRKGKPKPNQWLYQFQLPPMLGLHTIDELCRGWERDPWTGFAENRWDAFAGGVCEIEGSDRHGIRCVSLSAA